MPLTSSYKSTVSSLYGVTISILHRVFLLFPSPAPYALFSRVSPIVTAFGPSPLPSSSPPPIFPLFLHNIKLFLPKAHLLSCVTHLPNLVLPVCLLLHHLLIHPSPPYSYPYFSTILLSILLHRLLHSLEKDNTTKKLRRDIADIGPKLAVLLRRFGSSKTHTLLVSEILRPTMLVPVLDSTMRQMATRCPPATLYPITSLTVCSCFVPHLSLSLTPPWVLGGCGSHPLLPVPDIFPRICVPYSLHLSLSSPLLSLSPLPFSLSVSLSPSFLAPCCGCLGRDWESGGGDLVIRTHI